MSRSERLMQKKQQIFLQALSGGLSVVRAAQAARVARGVIYAWRKRDPVFASAWDEALEDAADYLEDEARRRAVEGVEEVVYYGGKPVGTVRKYSDGLLTMLLKGRRPAVYRDRVSAEVSGPNGGPVELSYRERSARIEALLQAAAERMAEAGKEKQSLSENSR